MKMTRVEDLYDIIEEILENYGKSVTNTITMRDWNSVVGEILLDHTDSKKEIIDVFKLIDLLSPTDGLRILRYDK
jgi:Ca2+-binding EF-hand superfamily protein